MEVWLVPSKTELIYFTLWFAGHSRFLDEDFQSIN
jgi:hypothetical protein